MQTSFNPEHFPPASLTMMAEVPGDFLSYSVATHAETPHLVPYLLVKYAGDSSESYALALELRVYSRGILVLLQISFTTITNVTPPRPFRHGLSFRIDPAYTIECYLDPTPSQDGQYEMTDRVMLEALAESQFLRLCLFDGQMLHLSTQTKKNILQQPAQDILQRIQQLAPSHQRFLDAIEDHE